MSTSENTSGLVYLLSDIGCFNMLVEGREELPRRGKGRGASHRVGGAASSGAIDQVVMSSLVDDDVESGNRLISSEQKCSLEEEHRAPSV